MTLITNAISLMTLLSSTYAVIIIPDSVPEADRTLVYYNKECWWNEADAVCRANGGYLFHVDGQEAADELYRLKLFRGGMDSVFTAMVRYTDNKYYVNDTICRTVNISDWIWDNGYPWDTDRHCVSVSPNQFKWDERQCTSTTNYVCEYSEECQFNQSTSVSLVSIPVNNANMAVCQDQCRQIIGCFATAPDGHATNCLFVVTGDSTSPMAVLDCPLKFESDHQTECPTVEYPSQSLPDCGQTQPKTVRLHLNEIQSNTTQTQSVCLQTAAIAPSPVVETAYVTVTPAAISAYATLTQTVTYTQTQIESACQNTTQTETQTVTDAPAPVSASDCPVCSTNCPYILTSTLTDITTVMLTALESTVCPTPESAVSMSPVVDSTAASSAIVTTMNKTKEEALKEMEEVVKELTLEPRNVSRFRRLKECAPDGRQSARIAGSWAVGIMAVVGLLIVLSDGTTIYRHVQRLKEEQEEYLGQINVRVENADNSEPLQP